ncbi:unnamed protein product [Candida verbasci]|uniref:Uncharacterized protein n=1 Tax=Candida verbasci TaxID=1227364 RepID=A0A9W4XF78_9ASCO|nr:unnamed protein product [Candida verbasci]
MAFLFKRNPKTPFELIKTLNDSLLKLDYNDKKIQDDCTRYLKQLRIILHGEDDIEPQQDQIYNISQEIFQQDCLYHLIINLLKLDFDSRKDVFIIFSVLLRRNKEQQNQPPPPIVNYLLNSQPEILLILLRGPETHEIGIISGQILRECIKYETINKFILYNSLFWNFFNYVQIPIFELATDAMMTLNDLLTIHRKQVSEFLNDNYDKFVTTINNLIDSENYVTKRQSVKLLNDLNSSRANSKFINKYYDDTVNLKKTMRLLSENSKNLQLEGFHILKFFMANPKRSQKINDLLIKNKINFLIFLKNFDVESFHDPTLTDEKDFVLQEIERLPDRKE